MNYNKNLLESILSDRYWLIETLVDGNLNNNIYAATNGQTGFMLNEVLENYQKMKRSSSWLTQWKDIPTATNMLAV